MVAILCLLPLLLAAANSQNIHVEELKKVVKLERELLHNFRAYVEELGQIVRLMNDAAEEYSQLLKYADKQPDLYMSNPIFAFRLMNHIRYDWRMWYVQMLRTHGSRQLELHERLVLLVPKAPAHAQAAVSLHSLFRFYNFRPATFLMHRKRHLRLNPWDYYHMGRELYEQGKHYEALQWLAVARGNYTASPHSQLLGATAERIAKVQSDVLDALKSQSNESTPLIEINQLLTEGRSQSTPDELVSEVQQQCSGNYEKDLQLVCYLNNDFTPFVQLAPLRMEEVLYEPIVVLYRNGITDREIVHLRNAFDLCPAGSLLTRVPGMKICSVSHNFSSTSIRLMERLIDMSGFQHLTKHFFMLEYSPRDPFRLQDLYKFLNVKGEEVHATAILFLNNMDMGGAITLANHELAAFPSRGDALLFFFEDDFRITICPNVVGNRLVLIQFLTNEN